ncbi:nucleotidyltransferase domain-containing protein [Candidatus Pacearchaeota archaeon]|nr:nucleotidyltransferase domain-containing protein [Candidatus Pacearchaeota archaeon]
MSKMQRKQEQGFSAVFGDLEISHLEGTIIASFFPEAEEMTLKEIQERIDYSYERVNFALKSLREKKIVKEESKGKTLIYSLDLNSPYVYSLGFIRYLLQREVDFIRKHKTIYKAIQEVENNHLISELILFGSYSKGTETKNSDVDILVTCFPGKEREVEISIKSLKHKYGIDITPVVLSLIEFPNIKKDNPELWNDLKIHGVVFKGDDTFYYWMYKNEEN